MKTAYRITRDGKTKKFGFVVFDSETYTNLREIKGYASIAKAKDAAKFVCKQKDLAKE